MLKDLLKLENLIINNLALDLYFLINYYCKIKYKIMNDALKLTKNIL